MFEHLIKSYKIKSFSCRNFFINLEALILSFFLINLILFLSGSIVYNLNLIFLFTVYKKRPNPAPTSRRKILMFFIFFILGKYSIYSRKLSIFFLNYTPLSICSIDLPYMKFDYSHFHKFCHIYI